MESPPAATRQRAQTPLAANAARPLDLIDASPIPLVAAASAGGGVTRLLNVVRASERMTDGAVGALLAVRDDVTMSVRRLAAQEAARLRAAPFSYQPVGGPRPHHATAGFDDMQRSTVLVRRDFDAAAHDLLSWRVHDGAGLLVCASDIPLELGTVTLMRWGVGPLSVKIPCRVVNVIDEARRKGFSYGTLPGHPEAGEEQFLLEQRDDGRIDFTITAFSRPASTLARLGGPITRAAQRFMTQRYLMAIDR